MFLKYKWKKRLLISYFRVDEFHPIIIEEINRYFIQKRQEIEERQLKHITITRDDFDTNQIPVVNKNTFGLYLIGLDGTLKRYSKDLKLLESLLTVIDSMPMRKMGIKK
jgi:hypothetical protein